MNAFLGRVDRVLSACWRWLGIVANLSLLAIMFGVSSDAILRYALGQPIAGMLEGVELLLVLSVFLSLAGTQAAGGHIAVDIVSGRLGGKARAALMAFTSALGMLLFATVAWATGGMALRSWEIGEYSPGLIAFPIYPSRMLVALGSVLLAVQLLLELARALVQLCCELPARTDTVAPGGPES